MVGWGRITACGRYAGGLGVGVVGNALAFAEGGASADGAWGRCIRSGDSRHGVVLAGGSDVRGEIGRASCRERGEMAGGAVVWEAKEREGEMMTEGGRA